MIQSVLRREVTLEDDYGAFHDLSQKEMGEYVDHYSQLDPEYDPGEKEGDDIETAVHNMQDLSQSTSDLHIHDNEDVNNKDNYSVGIFEEEDLETKQQATLTQKGFKMTPGSQSKLSLSARKKRKMRKSMELEQNQGTLTQSFGPQSSTFNVSITNEDYPFQDTDDKVYAENAMRTLCLL